MTSASTSERKTSTSDGKIFLDSKNVFPPLMEYIFPLPRNAFPREGTGVKTDFFFREKVSLSAVVGKKDGCLTDRSSCLPERSEGRQRREVRQSFRPETKERETFSRKRKRSDRTISLPGKRFLSRGMHFLS